MAKMIESISRFANYIAEEKVIFQVTDNEEVALEGLIQKVCNFVKKAFVICADAFLSLLSSSYITYKEQIKKIIFSDPIAASKENSSAKEPSKWGTTAKMALIGAAITGMGLIAYQFLSWQQGSDKMPELLNALKGVCREAVNNFCRIKEGQVYCLKDYLTKDWIPKVYVDSKYFFKCDIDLQSKDLGCSELVGNPESLPRGDWFYPAKWPFIFKAVEYPDIRIPKRFSKDLLPTLFKSHGDTQKVLGGEDFIHFQSAISCA